MEGAFLHSYIVTIQRLSHSAHSSYPHLANRLQFRIGVEDYVTQVVSIPDMKPVVKEIRHYITVCKQCGERIQSHAPCKRGSNAVVYDATVKSLVVYLSVVMFLPYGRIENFFKEVFGLDISQGSFVNWVNEAK